MGQKNSYFQLELRPTGVFIKIYPPKEGGRFLSVHEVTEYLEGRGCKAYALTDLNRLLFLQQVSELRVGDSDGIAVNERMKLAFSPDNMTVTARFYPASSGGSRMDEQEILNDLQYAGIRTGVQKEEIQRFLQEPVYCTDYTVAKGQPPVPGTDARITYFFNTDVNLKPKRNEDGTVDYHELDTICHVNAGDLLARLTPAKPGQVGTDVCGHEIKPYIGKELKLSYAHNITLSEDGTELYSDVNGHVSLVEGKVFVADIYEVPADVDNSIGNINYVGNIHVRGNVKGGFTVTAKGDIVVEGVVEDSVLQAGGQIIVKRGIHGKTKGTLKAGGNIVCSFIENAIVEAGGYIETESILHSQVSAGSEVKVNGRKGFITGGMIRAGSLIEALTIGSEMGATTNLEVGIAPERKERYTQLQKELAQLEKEIDQIRPILATYSKKMSSGESLKPETVVYIQKLARALQSSQQRHAETKREFTELHEEIARGNAARIKIKRSIYPGVTVSISDVSMTLKEERSFCQLLKEQGEIVIRTL